MESPREYAESEVERISGFTLFEGVDTVALRLLIERAYEKGMKAASEGVLQIVRVKS